MTRVAGVVLAAGLSSRMGQNKLLLELGGTTVVARAAQVALDAGLDPVRVVVGHQADQVRAAIAHLPVGWTLNPDPARGLHTSVRAGIAASAEPDVAAAVILLADMPLVTAAMVRRLVAAWSGAAPRPPLVLSVHGDVVAPPILYDAALFAELGAIDERGTRPILERHRGAALRLIGPATTLADLDVPDDIARVTDLLAEERSS